MRRRSNTLYADNLDDYMTAAKETTYVQPMSKKPATASRRLPLEDNDTCLPEAKRPLKDTKFCEDSDAYWNDFDFDSDHTQKDGSTMPSLTLSDNTVETDCSEEHERVSIVRRVMVIGMAGSGKHSLINSVFDCGEKISGRKSQIMDLMTKTEEDEEEGVQVRYQFWIQSVSEEEMQADKLKELIKVYYKNVSMFVFVYSISSRKSLERLDEAIHSVLDEVPGEKFQAVLLGNKADIEDEREVEACEGVVLKEKYQMSLFSETSLMNLSLKEKLVPLMKEKENSLNAKKVHSLLSID